jgi:hypothetical protein
MTMHDPEATRAFAEAHPVPEPVETIQPIVVQTHVFGAAETTVHRIGTRNEDWKPEPPPAQLAHPASPVTDLRGGVEVERSREQDSVGNPMTTRITLR